MEIDEKALEAAYRTGGLEYKALRKGIEAYEAAKVAEQPCPGINTAALDQAAAARKRYRADTPTTLYSIEGEDAVFIAAYLEATSAGQPASVSHEGKSGDLAGEFDSSLPSQQPDEYAGGRWQGDGLDAPAVIEATQALTALYLEAPAAVVSDVFRKVGDAFNYFRQQIAITYPSERESAQQVDCRKAFELWVGDTCFDREDNGKYEVSALEKRWVIWQAGWNARVPERES